MVFKDEKCIVDWGREPKIYHIIENWLDNSNIDFRPEMYEDFKYSLAKIGYVPTLPEQCIYRGITIPKEQINSSWGYKIDLQPKLTSWSTDVKVAREFGNSFVLSYQSQQINNSNIFLNFQDLTNDKNFKNYYEYYSYYYDYDYPNIRYYLFENNNKEREIICDSIPFEQVKIYETKDQKK